MYGIEDLAAELVGLADTEQEDDFEEIDRLLMEKFNIDYESFEYLIKALIPFTISTRTALGNKLCQGFVKGNAFLVKALLPEPPKNQNHVDPMSKIRESGPYRVKLTPDSAWAWCFLQVQADGSVIFHGPGHGLDGGAPCQIEDVDGALFFGPIGAPKE